VAVARLLSSQKPGDKESCLSKCIFCNRFSTSKKPPQDTHLVLHTLNLLNRHMNSFYVQLKKVTTNLISRILFLNYHLSSLNITAKVLLPTLGLERVALKRPFTWHYSTQGLPYKTITCLIREPLPHVFTFSSCEVVIFCGTFSIPLLRCRLLTGGLPYAVRTFLGNCLPR